MFNNPLTIGSFEAHLLAVVVGALLWRGSFVEWRRVFHATAAGVHVVLGARNLLFFEDAFGALDLRGFGVAVTTVHGVLAAAQAIAASRAVALPEVSPPHAPFDVRSSRRCER